MFIRWVLQAVIILQCLSLLAVTRAAPNGTLNRETANIPGPLVIPPSQQWLGNDGPWSSFFIRIGSPVQTLTVLISTASNQPLVVLPEGCTSSDPPNCSTTRGGNFRRENSTSWKQNDSTKEGIFALAIEANQNLSVNALYGNESIGLSYLGSGAPSLDEQLVGGIASKDIYTGMIGLNPASTNFTDYNNPIQSYMSTLKSQNRIPSLSYGYTAGNQYRFNKVLGSLTLGGYDASIFEPNELVVGFNGDSNTDLTINVNSISMSAGDMKRNLSTAWFPAFIDSTLPYLYLPLDVCRRFEEEFGIIYDVDTELYLVNEELHTHLLSQAANVTFTLTNVTSQVLVDIVLPYHAFDLIADYPLVKNATRYFPLKRAKDNTQTTLGRAFLQEAYLVADYERFNFFVYQRRWDANAKADIHTILPPSTTSDDTGDAPPKSKSTDNSHSHAPIAIIIASVLGGVVLITVMVGCVIIIRQRSQKLRSLRMQSSLPNPILSSRSLAQPCSEMISPAPRFRTELDAAETLNRSLELEPAPSLPMFPILASTAAPARQRIYELPGNESFAELIGSPVSPLYEYQLSQRQHRMEQSRRWIRDQQQSRNNRVSGVNPRSLA